VKTALWLGPILTVSERKSSGSTLRTVESKVEVRVED
jgi:hypothetical protein